MATKRDSIRLEPGNETINVGSKEILHRNRERERSKMQNRNKTQDTNNQRRGDK